MKKKIHVEDLTEKAYDWWHSLLETDMSMLITQMYMEEHKITEDEVEW